MYANISSIYCVLVKFPDRVLASNYILQKLVKLTREIVAFVFNLNVIIVQMQQLPVPETIFLVGSLSTRFLLNRMVLLWNFFALRNLLSSNFYSILLTNLIQESLTLKGFVSGSVSI